MASCCHSGPGYASPLDAFRNGEREKLAYVPAIVVDGSRPDYLATVDLDPESETYSQVIHRLPMKYIGDELHHSGWNACSSCFGDTTKFRNRLILPALGSGRIYSVDVATDPRAPRLAAIAEPEDIQAATGLTTLHTSHCLGSGELLVSAMGDKDGNGVGGLILFDQDLKVVGTWGDETTEYGYDFWYQPRLDVLVSTSWGAPKAFRTGFDPSKVGDSYGDAIYIWSWAERRLKQTLHLGNDGLIPLEVRFLHDPASPHGYVGAALASNVLHFTQTSPGGDWAANVVIRQPWLEVEGWALPELPPLITDILISLDDKYLYFSNWLQGDIVQYDISDPLAPRFAGRVWVGGVIRADGDVKVTSGLDALGLDAQPEIPRVKGHTLRGGPQMIQLSLDGKRLYVSNSLYSAWDKQFYPDMVKKGSYILQIDVDTEHGGLKINPDFYVDFGAEPDGPALVHEIRYPGGDCSSDIWL